MPQMPTGQRILDIAEGLVARRGFNAFSYADIAAEMNITKASLHYHFASKSELGTKLINRYQDTYMAVLEAISRETADAGERLRRYVRLWLEVLRDDRMCLCGMLAAEFSTLAPPMKIALKAFMDRHEAWLAGVMQEGLSRGEVRFEGTPEEIAGLMIGALEGTMMLARAHNEIDRFILIIRRMLGRLGVAWEDEAVG
jgi:TetR/AcrR family transcriptional regulator, transcriptional repressor for nem operon